MIGKHTGKCIKLGGALLLASWAATVLAVPSYTLVSNVMPGATVSGTYSSNAGIGYGPFEPYGYYSTDFPSMNEVGDLVGRSSGRATVWKREGDIVNLGLVGCGSTVSSCSSRASAINNYGFVVGASTVSSGFYVYFEQGHQWANGRAEPVYWSGQSNTLDINDRGDKVTTGISGSDYLRHGFVLTSIGKEYRIGNDNTQKSTAVAVNSSGAVTGALDVNQAGQRNRAYIWKNGAMSRILNTLGGNYGAGYDINDNGDVVGESMDAAGNLLATAWLWGGNARSLGTLGGTASVARAVNSQRQVVGFSLTASGQKRAFLWENGIMYDLASLVTNGSGVAILDAYKITNRGHILARTSSGYVVLASSAGWPTRPKMNAVTPQIRMTALGSIGSSSSSTQDTIEAVDTDAQGNIYRVGRSGGADMDYDPGVGVINGATGVDEYIQKLSPDGKVLWVKHIRPIIRPGYTTPWLFEKKLIVDPANGSFYIIGGMGGGSAWDFDPGLGVAENPRSDHAAVLLAKYDLDGNFLRLDAFKGWLFDYVYANDVVIDGQSNLYILFNATGKIDFDPTVAGVDIRTSTAVGFMRYDPSFFLTKLSANGSYLWTKTLTGLKKANSMALGIGDTLYIAGSALDKVDFDPGPGITERQEPSSGIFLASYSPEFALNWVTTIPRAHTQGTVKVAADRRGGLYLAYPSYDADSYNVSAHMLSKYNDGPTGGMQWIKPVTGRIGDMKADNEGVFFSGHSFHGGNLNTDSRVFDMHYPGTFITKRSASGSYMWSYSIPYAPQGGHSPGLLTKDNDGNISQHGGYQLLINSPDPAIPGIASPWQDDIYQSDVYNVHYRRIAPIQYQ